MNLIFDIDDTLFPSTEFTKLARRNAIIKMVEKGLYEKIPKEYQRVEVLEEMMYEILYKKGSNYPKVFDDLLKSLNAYDPKFVASAVYGYHLTKSLIRPYEEAPYVLYRLSKKHKLYVASSGLIIKQWDKLIRMGLDLFFEKVFITEKKKDAEFFKKIKKELKNGIMIGDREDSDIIPAKKVGLITIRVRKPNTKYNFGKSIADYEIRNLNEIFDILKGF